MPKDIQKRTTDKEIAAMVSEIKSGGKKRLGVSLLRVFFDAVFILLIALSVFFAIQIQTLRETGGAQSLFGFYLYMVENNETGLDKGDILLVNGNLDGALSVRRGDNVLVKTAAGKEEFRHITLVLSDGTYMADTGGEAKELLPKENIKGVALFKVPLKKGSR